MQSPHFLIFADVAADEWDDEDGGVNEGAAGEDTSVSMSCSGAENKVRLSIAERKKLVSDAVLSFGASYDVEKMLIAYFLNVAEAQRIEQQ